MTTGEKIIKCRKIKDLTQEQMAELLGVSRQSVSKWESDAAFPETNKLKDLAKLFNVTIDYLLNDDSEENKSEENDATKEVPKNKFKAFLKAKSTRVLYYSLIEFMFFSLLFMSPVAHVQVYNPFIEDTYFEFSVNMYQILGATDYKIGNVFVLLAYLSLLGSLLCGVIYSINKKAIVHRIKQIFMLLSAVFFVVTMFIVLKNMSVGLIMVVIFSIANQVGYFFFYKKFVGEKKPAKQEKAK